MTNVIPFRPAGNPLRNPLAAPAAPIPSTGIFGRVLGAAADLMRLERACRELRRLDERWLRDIGLDPGPGRGYGETRSVALAWCAETGTCFFRGKRF